MDDATRRLLQRVSEYLYHVGCESTCDCEDDDPTFECSTCEAKRLAEDVDKALNYSVKGE